MTNQDDEADNGEETVEPGWECPRCGENRVDYLRAGDGDEVYCTTCGMLYWLNDYGPPSSPN